jgi:hypothetical protein
MILAFTGVAGVGKDAAADALVHRFGFVRIGLADPIKRAVADWFGWDEKTLWGPSENRNKADPRFDGLSPRRALQFIGTEIGRELYRDVWIEYGLRKAKTLLACACVYEKTQRELFPCRSRTEPVKGVVFTDARFANEVMAVKKAGGKVVRIVRPYAGLEGAAAMHLSEVEQAGIPDEAFDAVITNDGTLAEFEAKIVELVAGWLNHERCGAV